CNVAGQGYDGGAELSGRADGSISHMADEIAGAQARLPGRRVSLDVQNSNGSPQVEESSKLLKAGHGGKVFHSQPAPCRIRLTRIGRARGLKRLLGEGDAFGE